MSTPNPSLKPRIRPTSRFFSLSLILSFIPCHASLIDTWIQCACRFLIPYQQSMNVPNSVVMSTKIMIPPATSYPRHPLEMASPEDSAGVDRGGVSK
eukprot:3521509-Rhodomonas_salina.2